MFNKPTVFIVGAGASAECGLPTGSQLKDRIRGGLGFQFEGGQLRKGDEALLQLLRGRFSQVNPYITAGHELSATITTFPSIDEVLHRWKARPEIVELGKLAIAHYILDAERRSPLAGKQRSVNIEAANDKWLATFMSMSLSGLTQGEVSRAFENITIINFNYDRTIETYLYSALQRRGGISSEEAKQCVTGLKVIRPYGSIGKLDWQDQAGIPYGEENSVAAQVEKNIRTFTEQAQEETVPASINQALGNAEIAIFLGFGFHQQNMKLFEPITPGNRKVHTLMATTKGIDDKNHEAITRRLLHLGIIASPTLVACKAGELLIQLRPTITMAAV
jgi:hypothetical protein